MSSNNGQKSDARSLDEDTWREEFREILDNIEKKGDYCIGKDVTNSIPRFFPLITVDGLNDGENDNHLAFPLLNSQARHLRSIAEKAPFGKGTATVLDETVRKAWQIDAAKVHFRDSGQWQTILRRIVLDCVSSLGMTGVQTRDVQANLYKMLLYEPGGFFKKHRDTEKEAGMFGTLIIQLPSKFTGGELVIEHAGDTRTFDFSARSNEGIFATAFYADCEHELLPVKEGWRLCLAYNLVMRQNNPLPLPCASGLIAQLQEVQKLESSWDQLFGRHAQGYLLEYNYTEKNLHFSGLKGRDKEVTDFLRGARGIDGNPLFVVCLMLIEKHESGEPEPDYGGGNYRYRRSHYGDSDSDSDEEYDHTMGDIYETETRINHWIGPDDNKMLGFRLHFDLKKHLLTDEDPDDVFGEDPSRTEYEGYTGNAGPTLDYWYYRSAVVFWPRSINTKLMESAGVSLMTSYLNVALPHEICDIGCHIVKLAESKNVQISTSILTGVCKTGDGDLILRALKCCKTMPDIEFARVLAGIPCSRSDEANVEILEIVKNTSSAKKGYSAIEPLSIVFEFIQALDSKGLSSLSKTVEENMVAGALTNIAEIMKSSNIMKLSKIAFRSKNDVFRAFCNVVKANKASVPPVLKGLVSLGNVAIQHPLVVDLASTRATLLKERTEKGAPAFSWRMPSARFNGSQGLEVTSFLCSQEQSQTFYGFNGVGHARNWAGKYFGGHGQGSGYSATADAGGIGKKAYVTVTKTSSIHQKFAAQFVLDKKELEELRKHFGDTLDEQYDPSSFDAEYQVPGDKSLEESAVGALSFSWKQPDANFPGSQAVEVNEFLRGEEKSKVIHNFNGISHAQNWSNKYFNGPGQGSGYSATATVGEDGNGAYVTITKTSLHEKTTRGVRNSEKGSKANQHRTNSDDGPPSKKPRE